MSLVACFRWAEPRSMSLVPSGDWTKRTGTSPFFKGKSSFLYIFIMYNSYITGPFSLVQLNINYQIKYSTSSVKYFPGPCFSYQVHVYQKTNWAIFTSLVQLNKQPAGYFRSNQTPGSATRRLVLRRDCRGEPWRALSPFILDENQLVLVGGWAAPVPHIYIYGWWFESLWKIWVRQIGSSSQL